MLLFYRPLLPLHYCSDGRRAPWPIQDIHFAHEVVSGDDKLPFSHNPAQQA